MSKLLMPKATAVWLIDNTTLSFEQIAAFTGLHRLEIQALADGDVAPGMQGMDPIQNGQLTRDEIARCEADDQAVLKLAKSDIPMPVVRNKGPRYTPVSKRADKPDGISWLVKHHPELTDAQIGRLIGTTKPTIQKIRDKSHWNAANFRPRSPVELGLCSQLELSTEIAKAIKAGRQPLAEPIVEDHEEDTMQEPTGWEGLS
ncbi:DUF1013 domain-containing protein [Curvivirga aplysinae]|uniref:DUF1013 domain-containing protein n=1 Tax=Curvivirga aplysinae TaxID=2529852 RepID=UPI0012BC59B6|nr:cell cycle transcriptional regulator TrcR [Curvivirga aplysinae]MTI09269.1 DUF1013 domain-containing protein [Curvivirga aplysinae]